MHSSHDEMKKNSFDYEKTYYKVMKTKCTKLELKTDFKTGFHFYELRDVVKMLKNNVYVYEVTVSKSIPVTEQTVGLGFGYKAKHITLSNPLNPTEFIEKYNLEECAVEYDGLLLRFIDFQSKITCMKAVRNNGLALRYVSKPDFEICNEAVNNNIDAFQFVSSPLANKLIKLLKGKTFVINNNNVSHIPPKRFNPNYYPYRQHSKDKNLNKVKHFSTVPLCYRKAKYYNKVPLYYHYPSFDNECIALCLMPNRKYTYVCSLNNMRDTNVISGFRNLTRNCTKYLRFF
jgi:hypothetical protein